MRSFLSPCLSPRGRSEGEEGEKINTPETERIVTNTRPECWILPGRMSVIQPRLRAAITPDTFCLRFALGDKCIIGFLERGEGRGNKRLL